MSQANGGEVPWPPRSPHEARIGTPGGRDRLRRLAQRTSPSPSPIRRSKSTPSRLDQAAMGLDGLDEDDEDDDEETLQLQLQEIQARLKLKKLQKARAKDGAGSDVENQKRKAGNGGPLSRANSAATSYSGRDLGPLREQREGSKSQSGVHVPASPVKRMNSEQEATSPGRVRLGIDKGLKGSDISLGRAPSLKNRPNNYDNVGGDGRGYLERTKLQLLSQRINGTESREPPAENKAPSFSERMANSRTDEAKRRDLAARIKSRRTDTFGISEEEMTQYKSAATTIPETQSQSRQTDFSREQVLNNYNKASSGHLQTSKTMPNLNSTTRVASTSTTTSVASTKSESKAPSRNKGTAADDSVASVEFESFSSLHLSKRILPHNVLTRTLSGKKIYTVPDLLKEVKAPAYSLPEIEEDIVLMAVVASKSEPRLQKLRPGQSEDDRKKFMVLTLCDLKWEVDLFLFNTGFEKFWKLTVGTVIAILNPGIMPPVKADTNRFSLTIHSDDDTVLEIGAARDLGFCNAVKKDSKFCSAWIDKRHTEFCEFHTNEALKKTKAGRMEVNTMNFGYGGGGQRKSNSQDMTGWTGQDGKRKKGNSSALYVSKGGGPSAASLIDLEVAESFDRGISKNDLMARRRAEAERERDIALKLGELGGGMGADYMRVRNPGQKKPQNESSSGADPAPVPGASQLGLLGGKGKDVHLSPIKRKRAGTGTSNAGTGTGAAIGWGGNLSKELARMKDGERLQPVKKKTRFITPNGIREAGRDSFGGEASKTALVHDNDDDDDDDLDIVKD